MLSRVKRLFADGAYDRLRLMDKAAYLDFVLESFTVARVSEALSDAPPFLYPLKRRVPVFHGLGLME